MLGQAVEEARVQRDLLALLREDFARQEHVQRVVDSSTKVFDSFAPLFF